MVADVDGVAGDELRGGDGFGHDWGSALRWLSVEAQGLGGSARWSGVVWWRWEGRGGSGCAERSREAAVAELAGVGEDGLFPLKLTTMGY